MSIIKFSVEHLEWLNRQLARAQAEEIIQWAVQTLPQLIQSTAFGPSGMVIMDMVHKQGHEMPTLFIDTLHHFKETLEHAQSCEKHFKLDLKVYRCKDAANEAEFAQKHGASTWRDEPGQYDQLVKVEPQRRALRELEVYAWLNGRRRSQGGERTEISILEYDADGRLKVNPLAFWDYDQVWDYIKKNNVPYNPLHDQGYKSIGDYMTTAPVGDGEDERSGRWQGSSKTECGLHLDIPDTGAQL